MKRNTQIGNLNSSGTKIKQLKAELRETKQIIDNISNGITDSILLLAPDLKIIWANSAVEKSSGLKLNDIIGRHCYEITHKRKTPCQPPNDICPIIEVVRTGKVADVVHTHFSNKNEPLFVEVSAYPIKDKKGKILHFVHVGKNITERKKAEDEIRRMNAELKSKIEELERFNNFAIGRELKMIELKKKISELEKKK